LVTYFGIPWFHHVILIEKLKDLPTRFWYIEQTIEQGWSRDTLAQMIKNSAHMAENFGMKTKDRRRQ